MIKKFIAILLAVVCLCSSETVFATEYEILRPAVYVDSEALGPDCCTLLLEGTTFVSLRDVSGALGADTIEWCPESKTAVITCDGFELSATVGDPYIVANGRYLYIPQTVQNVEGKIMLPLRPLCTAFGASVQWNGEKFCAEITTGTSPLQDGAAYYQADTLYWLSHIIYAEAGNEPLEGRIAVGNVILNRVASDEFPDTVEGVVFDTRYCVQFTPIENGSIYLTPDEGSVIAAKLCLDGAETAGGSFYFIASYCAANSWAGRNRPFTIQIGNHCFFA